MVLNVAYIVLQDHDVIDDEFRAGLPDFQFFKCTSADDLAKVMPEIDILFINNQSYTSAIGKVVRGKGHRLKWIQFSTVGIDTARAGGLPDNVLLSNVRGLRTGILAGHAMALMLGVMRGFRLFDRFRRAEQWGRREIAPMILAPDGGTMVLLGLGEIGRDVARKAKAFDMHVIGVSRSSDAEWPIDELVPRERLADVLPRADVVMITLPFDETTRHYLGAQHFALLKPTAVVVNVSRGGVIDEAALIEALRAGRFAGFATDVTEVEPLPAGSPLWTMEQVLLTPHLAGYGGQAQKQDLAKLLATNLKRFKNGERLYNQIARDGSILPGNVSL
jgi:phosphoglycerate dehydrogenase-like enzyme